MPSIIERVAFSGQVTTEAMTAALADAEKRLQSATQTGFIIDLTTMTGYDPACRAVFTDWYKRNSRRIACVAGVTHRASWRMIISAIGLATAGRFQSFASESQADSWVRGNLEKAA